jgi:hypothetical protein
MAVAAIKLVGFVMVAPIPRLDPAQKLAFVAPPDGLCQKRPDAAGSFS